MSNSREKKIKLGMVVVSIAILSIILLNISMLPVLSDDQDVVITITESPSSLVEGDAGEFVYEVDNRMDEEVDDLDLEIIIDGEVIQEETVSLNPDEIITQEFDHTFDREPGSSVVAVAPADEGDDIDVTSSTVTVTVLQEDTFNFSEVNSPSQIFEGERAVIEYEVVNSGEVRGQQDIEFYVEGELQDVEENVDLRPGRTFSGTFRYNTEIGGAEELDEEFTFNIESEDDRFEDTVEVRRVPQLQINDYTDQYPDGNVTGTYGQVDIPVEEINGVGTEGLEVNHKLVRDDGLVVFEDTITRQQLLGNEERPFSYDVGSSPNLRPGNYEARVTADANRAQEVNSTVEFRVVDPQSELSIDSFTSQFPNTIVGETSDYEMIDINVNEIGGNETRDFTIDLSIIGNNEGTVFEKTMREEIEANGHERFFFDVGEINQVDTYNAVVTVDADNAEETERSAVFSVQEGQPIIEVEDINPLFDDGFVGEDYGTVDVNVTETQGYTLENLQGQLIIEDTDGNIIRESFDIIESINGETDQLSYDLAEFEESDIYSVELVVGADGISSQNQATTFEILRQQSQLQINEFEDNFDNSISGEDYGDIEFEVTEQNGFETSGMLVEFTLSKGEDVVVRETEEDELDGDESRSYSFNVGTLVDTGEYIANATVNADNANMTSEQASFDVLDQSSFSVVSAEFSNPTIDSPGDSVNMTTAIENEGDINDTKEVELVRNDEVLQSQNVTIESRNIETVDFNDINTENLNHTETAEYMVRTPDDEYIVELNVRGAPSEFIITNTAPDEITVEQGQTGPDLYVTVRNQGDIEDITTISAEVFNVQRDTQRSISGGQFATATFDNIVPPNITPGQYDIEIETDDDNTTVPLTVLEPVDDSDDATDGTDQDIEDPPEEDDSMSVLILIIGSLIVGILLTLAVVALVMVMRSDDPLEALPLDSIPIIGEESDDIGGEVEPQGTVDENESSDVVDGEE